VIPAKSGFSTVPIAAITGNLGVNPAAATVAPSKRLVFPREPRLFEAKRGESPVVLK
jgi:hypothetical protein